MKIKSIKQKIAVKMAKLAAKIKEKTGNGGKASCLLALAGSLVLALGVTGCATASADPASRTMNTTYELDRIVSVYIGAGSQSNVVHAVVSINGDGVVASADSSGSTETTSPTQTPTNTTDLKLDARYNDPVGTASSTSQNLLDSIVKGYGVVKYLMQYKGTGTVPVTLKDGTQTTVQCADGQCSPCPDGVCNP